MTESAAPVPHVSPSSSDAAAPVLAGQKPLTAKQQQVWDLTRPIAEGGQGKTRAQAAAILGISAPVVSKTIQACYRKKGLKREAGQMHRTEAKKPELAAAVIDAATNPDVDFKLGKLREAYREAGIPIGTAEALIKRIRVRYYGAITATRSLKTQEILDLIGQKIHLALQYMDDKVMSEASFRDLALGTTAMIEKRQLLRGEPTSIISDHERKKLHELLPLAIAEAQRRGLTVDGKVMERTVEPG